MLVANADLYREKFMTYYKAAERVVLGLRLLNFLVDNLTELFEFLIRIACYFRHTGKRLIMS